MTLWCYTNLFIIIIILITLTLNFEITVQHVHIMPTVGISLLLVLLYYWKCSTASFFCTNDSSSGRMSSKDCVANL